MVMTLHADILVDGKADGLLLKLDAPICFWGGVDAESGRIADLQHPNFQAVIASTILAVPRIVGSSSSSQLLLELIYRKNQPAAIVLGEPDAILPTGVLVADEMGFGTVPILHAPLERLRTGMRLRIDGGRIHGIEGRA